MTVCAVTFDFGGTLDAEGVHWFDRFARLYEEAGFRSEPQRLREAFDYATRAGYSQPSLSRVGLLELVTFHVRAQWEFLGWGWNEVGASLAERFVAEERLHLRRSRRVLEQLRPDLRIGVISNFYGNLHCVLDQAGMGALVDVALDSAVVGVRKPAPEIFALAARKLGLAPAAILHVGDSLAHDVRAARNAGCQSAWLVGTQTVPLSERAEVGWVLQSLQELPRLIPEISAAALSGGPPPR